MSAGCTQEHPGSLNDPQVLEHIQAHQSSPAAFGRILAIPVIKKHLSTIKCNDLPLLGTWAHPGNPDDPQAEAAEQEFWATYTTSWAYNEDLAMTWGIDPAFKVGSSLGQKWRPNLQATASSSYSPHLDPVVEVPVCPLDAEHRQVALCAQDVRVICCKGGLKCCKEHKQAVPCAQDATLNCCKAGRGRGRGLCRLWHLLEVASMSPTMAA